MFTFLDMLEMVVYEAVAVPTFVLGGFQGSTGMSDLVNHCVLCVSVRKQRGTYHDF